MKCSGNTLTASSKVVVKAHDIPRRGPGHSAEKNREILQLSACWAVRLGQMDVSAPKSVCLRITVKDNDS